MMMMMMMMMMMILLLLLLIIIIINMGMDRRSVCADAYITIQYDIVYHNTSYYMIV